MIVKDGAQMLPGFLSGIQGLWDELVAVDTGSHDASVALLLDVGATVLHQPWADDFAAARNHSLDAASGDWVLVLDADEHCSGKPPLAQPLCRCAICEKTATKTLKQLLRCSFASHTHLRHVKSILKH